MSYSNPVIPTIAEPRGLDAVVQSLQLALATLPWLEKSFGRAWKFDNDLKAYSGSREYVSVLPNDNLTAQSFILANREERVVNFERFGLSTFERGLSVIVWCNLEAIDPNLDHVFTETLKNEVEKALKTCTFLKTIDEYHDEDAYTRVNVEDKYFMYPYSAFRFEITVAYPEDAECLTIWENG